MIVERRAEFSDLSSGAWAGGSRPAGAEPAVDFGPLKELTGFMLRLAQLQVFEAFFAEFGSRDIRPGQIGILVAIRENDGVRQGTLARALRIKRSNMAKIVRLLESDGMIRRCVPPSDRRAVELSLTPLGRSILERALPDIRANDRLVTGALNDAERHTLLRLLRKLTTAGVPEARA